jgi:hypothetical protein
MRRTITLLLVVNYGLFFPIGLQAEDVWEFGDYQMYTDPGIENNVLRVPPLRKEGLLRYSFVARVGGVSFEAVAWPVEELHGAKYQLRYALENDDGERLVLGINGREHVVHAHDWQIGPAAGYAESEFTAAVSLFGEGTNRHLFHIVYHPALRDTLLGLRILQADVVLIDPKGLWELPKWRGELVLGPGEKVPNVDDAFDAAEKLEKMLEEYEIESWVLTDVGEPALFSITGDQPRISVTPYFHFWIADYSDAEAAAHEWSMITRLIEEGLTKDLSSLEQRKAELERLFDDYEPTILPVESATARLRRSSRLFQRYNEAVFSSVQKLAQLSALFRFIKSEHPEQWRVFLEEIETVDIGPEVKTPNIWPRLRR